MRPPTRRRAERGQSIVEFALILPVLLLLTLGVVDAARIFTSWIALNSGVGEASLYATNPDKIQNWCSSSGAIACPPSTMMFLAANCTTVTPAPTPPFGQWCDDNDNIAYRLEVEAASLDTDAITMEDPICTTSAGVPVNPCDPTNPTIAFITVRASYEMDLIVPLIGTLIGSPVQMSASATAPIIPPQP